MHLCVCMRLPAKLTSGINSLTCSVKWFKCSCKSPSCGTPPFRRNICFVFVCSNNAGNFPGSYKITSLSPLQQCTYRLDYYYYYSYYHHHAASAAKVNLRASEYDIERKRENMKYLKVSFSFWITPNRSGTSVNEILYVRHMKLGIFQKYWSSLLFLLKASGKIVLKLKIIFFI